MEIKNQPEFQGKGLGRTRSHEKPNKKKDTAKRMPKALARVKKKRFENHTRKFYGKKKKKGLRKKDQRALGLFPKQKAPRHGGGGEE